MNAPKPRPSKPLSYTPPKNVEILKPKPVPTISDMPKTEEYVQNGPYPKEFDLFTYVMNNDPEFVEQLKQLREEITGETLGESIKRDKEKKRDMESPMTHRPFQQSEELRELQRQLNRGNKR